MTSDWSEVIEFESLPEWAQRKINSGEHLLTDDIDGHLLSAEEIAGYIEQAKNDIERAKRELEFWDNAKKPVRLSWRFAASCIFEALTRDGDELEALKPKLKTETVFTPDMVKF